MNDRAVLRGELQVHNSPLLLVIIANSPGLEPILSFITVDAQGFIKVSRAEGIGVEDPVNEMSRVIRSNGDETHDNNTLG